MRTIRFLLQKEFLQIFRNKSILPIIFVVPIVQLIILVHAATFEMKNIRFGVLDYDQSSISRKLYEKISSSPFFVRKNVFANVSEAERSLYRNEVTLVVVIPRGFEQELYRANRSKLQFLINAIDGIAAGLSNAYASAIVSDFGRQFILGQQPISNNKISQIQISPTYWYNPELNYKTFMVPGILVMLVTIVSMLLSAMNIVREKELGTIDQINVSPIKKHQFIIGKLLPFWIIALFELSIGLLVGKLLFDIPIVGSLALLFAVAAVYLLVTLGFGLFISTLANTQQQAMFVSFFFMIIFVMMSGLFTAVENMPEWAQWLNKINPIAYFIKIIRMILLKGSEFRHIAQEFYSLCIYAAIILSMAVLRYRKTT